MVEAGDLVDRGGQSGQPIRGQTGILYQAVRELQGWQEGDQAWMYAAESLPVLIACKKIIINKINKSKRNK